jgi:hypothetical protein
VPFLGEIGQVQHCGERRSHKSLPHQVFLAIASIIATYPTSLIMSPEAHFWIGIIPGLWDRKRPDQRWHIEGTHDAQVVAGKDIKALFGDVLTSVCSWELNLKDGVVWGYTSS